MITKKRYLYSITTDFKQILEEQKKQTEAYRAIVAEQREQTRYLRTLCLVKDPENIPLRISDLSAEQTRKLNEFISAVVTSK